MVDAAQFTEQQAQGLVGRYVRARTRWGGIPGGALGIVTDAEQQPSGWCILIGWNVPPAVKKKVDGVFFARADFEKALEQIT